MKLITLIFLAAFILGAVALPEKAQKALANSLEVGRNEDPNTWTCVGCDDRNKPLHTYIIQEKAQDVKSILSVYAEYTILAFRYTATIKNIGQDLLWAFQTQDQNAPAGCKVQKQMDGMWNTIRKDVLKGLRQTAHTGRLIITGISLGGALACLSYVDIAKQGIFENIQIITFGAPRVGNKKWAQWFDSITPSTRYFIARDPIAFLPRCLTLVCNYRQTGTAYVCHKNTKECIRKEVSEQNQMTTTEYLGAIADAITQHNNEDPKVDGILDHIYGYKTIYDYTQIN